MWLRMESSGSILEVKDLQCTGLKSTRVPNRPNPQQMSGQLCQIRLECLDKSYWLPSENGPRS